MTTLLDHLTRDTYTDPIYGVSLRDSNILVSSFIRNSNDNYISLSNKRFFHRLPASKISWISDDRFASISTSLRIWHKNEEQRPLLKLSPKSNIGSPLTSFDSSRGNKIATCSIDTTIAVWDLDRGKMETRMIAHDKAVFDVAFSPTKEYLFASVSDDGSMRLFDTRDLNHSTIVFEGSNPLLRLAWNDDNVIAAIASETKEVLFFDMRKVGSQPHKTYKLSACPNAIAWHGSVCVAALANGSVVAVESSKVFHSSSGAALNISCHEGKAAVVVEPKSVSLINLTYVTVLIATVLRADTYDSSTSIISKL